jgi:hypothetical protein
MNKKANLDKDALKLLYTRYKSYLIPIGAILICVFLFIYIISPQMQNIQDLQNQEKLEAKKLDILKSNLDLLYSLDSQTLDNQLKLVSKALPAEKDFIGVINGLSIVSSKSNTTLGDYGFSVGEIGKSPTTVKGVPKLEFTLTVNGSLNNLINFLKELKKTAPLSEIKTISLTNSSTTLSMIFYYKPLPPVVIRDDVALKPLSTTALETITNLAKMNNMEISDLEEITTVNSSSPSSIFSNTTR